MTNQPNTGKYPDSDDEERRLLQILQRDDEAGLKRCLLQGLNPDWCFSLSMEHHHQCSLLEACLAHQAPHCAKQLYQAGCVVMLSFISRVYYDLWNL